MEAQLSSSSSNVNDKRARTIDDDTEQEEEITELLQHKLRKIMKNVSENSLIQEQQELDTILNDNHEFMKDLIASAKKQAMLLKTDMCVKFQYISPICESYEFTSNDTNNIVKKTFTSTKEVESFRCIRTLALKEDNTLLLRMIEKKTGLNVRNFPANRFMLSW